MDLIAHALYATVIAVAISVPTNAGTHTRGDMIDTAQIRRAAAAKEKRNVVIQALTILLIPLHPILTQDT